MKSILAKTVLGELPGVEEQLRGGELWSDGYCVRSFWDKDISEVICRHIKCQHQEQLGFDS